MSWAVMEQAPQAGKQKNIEDKGSGGSRRSIVQETNLENATKRRVLAKL